MSKRITIISEYYYPEEHSTGYYVKGIAEKLAINNDVTVIYCTNLTKFKKEEVINSVRVIRVKGSRLNKDKPISRLIKSTIDSMKLIFKFNKLYKVDDVVISGTNPALIPVFLYGYSFFNRRLKINYIIHDVFPENLSASNIISDKNLIYRLTVKLYNKAYKNSLSIISVGRDMKELFENKTNLKKKNKYIPNWGKLNSTYDISFKNKELKRLDVTEGNIIFQYTGNLGKLQNINMLLEILENNSSKKVAFLFYGKGIYKKAIENSVNSKIVYGGVFSRDDSAKYMGVGDIAVVTLDSKMKGLGVPSKTYDYLAAGMPILYIGPKNSEIDLVIREHKIGYSCSFEDKEGINNVIQKFISMKEVELAEMRKRSKKVWEDYFNDNVILTKYDKLFSNDIN